MSIGLRPMLNVTQVSPAGAMGLRVNSYRYTDKLLSLEARAGPSGTQLVVEGFLPAAAWEPFLRSLPDQRLAAFLRRGIWHGFRIGFCPAQRLRQSRANLQSVILNPGVVSSYIEKEVSLGKLIRIAPAAAAFIHTSPIGIIPKPHQPGKYRLIVDLSSPQQASVNDGIDSDLCSLEYTTVGQAVSLVSSFGRGALMAKLDLRSAYRMVPVHLQDQKLLGIQWQGAIYCDRALPFGLRSAPILFTAVADGLAWALSCHGVRNFVHYLDDFFFCGPPASQECAGALEIAVSVCQRLGLPVAPEKVEGPATVITFLGIEVDTMKEEVRLPHAKLLRLQGSLAVWSQRRNATKHQLQSLLGQLNHAASVVRPGRTFLRHIIETMKIPKQSWQRVRLNEECKADIAWWSLFLPGWNGRAFFPPCLRQGPTVVSDASGSWGCGAFLSNGSGAGEWFQLKWPQSWANVDISAKELVPVVISAAIWGSQWADSRVTFWCDNSAVVQVLASRTARDPSLARLLQCLFFMEAHFGFDHVAHHIPGKANRAADALSRDRLGDYLSLFPQAPTSPTEVPAELVELVSDRSLTWTSPRWRMLLFSTLQAVSPREQGALTRQRSGDISLFASGSI